MNRLLLTFLLLACSMGCMWQRATAPRVSLTALPVSDAPKIRLRREAAPTISTVSHHVHPVVEFVDVRPEEERRYYPGETDAHRWRDAMTILPMESFQPGLESALRDQVVSAVDESDGVQRIEVRINSFHVALDERDRGEEELLYDLKKWDDKREAEEAADAEFRRRRDECKDNDDKLADALFRTLFVTPIKRNRLRREKYERTKVAPQTIPESLTRDKHSGWNCRLTADVVLMIADTEAVSMPVSVTSLEPKDDSISVESQIERAVSAAVKSFGIRLREVASEAATQRDPAAPISL